MIIFAKIQERVNRAFSAMTDVPETEPHAAPTYDPAAANALQTISNKIHGNDLISDIQEIARALKQRKPGSYDLRQIERSPDARSQIPAKYRDQIPDRRRMQNLARIAGEELERRGILSLNSVTIAKAFSQENDTPPEPSGMKKLNQAIAAIGHMPGVLDIIAGGAPDGREGTPMYDRRRALVRMREGIEKIANEEHPTPDDMRAILEGHEVVDELVRQRYSLGGPLKEGEPLSEAVYALWQDKMFQATAPLARGLLKRLPAEDQPSRSTRLVRMPSAEI